MWDVFGWTSPSLSPPKKKGVLFLFLCWFSLAPLKDMDSCGGVFVCWVCFFFLPPFWFPLKTHKNTGYQLQRVRSSGLGPEDSPGGLLGRNSMCVYQMFTCFLLKESQLSKSNWVCVNIRGPLQWLRFSFWFAGSPNMVSRLLVSFYKHPFKRVPPKKTLTYGVGFEWHGPIPNYQRVLKMFDFYWTFPQCSPKGPLNIHLTSCLAWTWPKRSKPPCTQRSLVLAAVPSTPRAKNHTN